MSAFKAKANFAGTSEMGAQTRRLGYPAKTSVRAWQSLSLRLRWDRFPLVQAAHLHVLTSERTASSMPLRSLDTNYQHRIEPTILARVAAWVAYDPRDTDSVVAALMRMAMDPQRWTSSLDDICQIRCIGRIE